MSRPGLLGDSGTNEPRRELSYRSSKEEAVLAEGLVERHQKKSILGGADLAVPVVGEEFPPLDRVEVRVTRAHPKLVIGGDGMPVDDIDDAR